MNRLALTSILLSLVACGGDMDSETGGGNLEIALVANETWPYETVGILDIVEAGYGDSDSPEWAVGSLVTHDDEYGVLISIEGAVIARAGIDIDSGEPVRVWLEAPKKEYGVDSYTVSRIQAR